jgi:hypothetical protein
MQTSRDEKFKHPKTRVSAVGVGVGLTIVVVAAGAILSCMPGSLDCPDPSSKACICKFTKCDGGGDGEGGAAGGGGAGGGSGGLPVCKKWNTIADLESKFIIPTCGRPKQPGQADKDVPGCHNGNFAPRMDGVDMPMSIGETLIASDPMGRLTCKGDKFVDKDNWEKSYIVAKSDPSLQGTPNIKDAAHCPSDGKPGKARMPFLEDPLSQEDYDCVRWYAWKLATQ